MSTSRLTQQDMTEAEQRELKTRLDRARIAHGRPLTNSEINHVKKTYIDQLIAAREQEAKKVRQIKKQKAAKPDTSATYSWSANSHSRGKR
ncbi:MULTISPECIES: DUF3811 domain-containing protein [Buttiauxella]|jgi:hypothetical protein|uniref:YjbD family (DUF3811) n=2 Tax=Buttiauxella TaxID=82976 RepID=A0A1B7HX47_9ENTR|nr:MULTISPECIES: DUF3811 domain-containing protein [Buttiauxella]MCT4708036.1 DUF3811 domain-containing protein [Dryocola clanedunensis]MRT15107.1 DUF3811 domain-containing protein [Enterobacteriaceae bacterium RIT711]MCE0801500.1 DUF3811 domain-containing protein [Buttiauxella sp. W03-F01]MCE0814391.1 DUF3811 domain-containing protein [Buttiauxella sp. S04-F03]MCE0846539.1 DUF3811 domain-containing protein [Buttiauxella sp. A2-C1_F]